MSGGGGGAGGVEGVGEEKRKDEQKVEKVSCAGNGH